MALSNHAPLSISKQPDSRHALVIGGSIAGLLAAHILADYFDQVTLLDRDTFPEMPDHRKGVPQSYHAHALLPKGQQIISQMFPGILDELLADGALGVSGVVPLVNVTSMGKLPSQRLDREFVAFSRTLLEWHIRHRLLKNSRIRLLPALEVTDLLLKPDNTQVIGVHTRERHGTARHDTIVADLVVDASGRHSHAGQWLIKAGYDAPREEIVHAQIGYASRFYAKPANFPDEWQGIIISRRPPHNRHSGFLLPIEHGRWHVTLGGIGGQYPSLDEEGFLQWAKELPDPSIYEALRIAKPLGPIRGYRTPANRLRHFGSMKRWPRGFIVTGDAVCAFNPTYGQGMTVSAMDALLLAECLATQQRQPRLDFECHFQRRLAKTVAAPWLMATREDLRWPEVSLSGTQPPLIRLIHYYMDLVLRCAIEDPVISQNYKMVQGMLAPPHSLISPRVLTRVLGSAFKRGQRGSAKNALLSQQIALSPEALASLRARPAWHEHTQGHLLEQNK